MFISAVACCGLIRLDCRKHLRLHVSGIDFSMKLLLFVMINDIYDILIHWEVAAIAQCLPLRVVLPTEELVPYLAT
jgi:hypothetical protein